MGQNRSTAVMSRRGEPHDSLDDFPTPPWATRALCEWLVSQSQPIDCMTVWEPACNRGYMARPLRQYFRHVHESDVHDYSDENHGQDRIADFLMPFSEPPVIRASGLNFIITNPPFRLADQFIKRACEFDASYAMFVRLAFLEGGERYRGIFSAPAQCPTDVLVFSERVPIVRGRVDGEASSATAYCWIVRLLGRAPRPVQVSWVPPGTRALLESDSDYPEVPPLVSSTPLFPVSPA